MPSGQQEKKPVDLMFSDISASNFLSVLSEVFDARYTRRIITYNHYSVCMSVVKGPFSDFIKAHLCDFDGWRTLIHAWIADVRNSNYKNKSHRLLIGKTADTVVDVILATRWANGR